MKDNVTKIIGIALIIAGVFLACLGVYMRHLNPDGVGWILMTVFSILPIAMGSFVGLLIRKNKAPAESG